MLTSFFALFVFVSPFFSAQAEVPTLATSANLVPQTVVVTMVLTADMDTPEDSANAIRACAFAAQHTKNFGFTVADYCNGPSLAENSVLPQIGDPVTFLVFASSPVDPGALRQALPPQATVGTRGSSVVALLSEPFAEGTRTDALTEGEGYLFSTVIVFPGNDTGRMARIFVRCLFESGPTGLSFEEASTCWERVSVESLAGDHVRSFGGWDPIFNGSRLFYPPRVPPTERSTSKTARELRKYDEQRRRQKPPPPAPVPEHTDPPLVTAEPPPPVTTPPLTPPTSTEPPPTSPLPTKRKPPGKWGTGKIVLTTVGTATAVTTGIALVAVYADAGTLAEDISAGKYGTTTDDSRLTAAIEEYERLGSTLPWLWAGVGTGAAVVGVGVALPMPKDSTVEATVSVGPSGLMFTGTF